VAAAGDAPLRVLHAGMNTAGGPLSLSRGMQRLGIESELWVRRAHSFGYGSDRDIGLRPGADPVTLLRNLPTNTRVFREALARFDVFHFHHMTTFIPKRVALPLLGRLGRGRVIQFWGSDIRDRPPDAVSYFMRHVDAGIVGSFATKMRSPTGPWPEYHVLPPAIDTDAWAEAPPAAGPVVRIVHAPSRRSTKRTDAVLAAADVMRSRGVPFELDLVEGLPHSEARKRYEAADIIVDQLGVGWYGLFATESLSMGKPVVCRIDPQARSAHEEGFGVRLPIVSAGPEDLADVLTSLVADRDRLPELGRESRAYAEAIHDHRVVARRCLAIYRAAGIDVPASLLPADGAPAPR
jgi:hypothetical protein